MPSMTSGTFNVRINYTKRGVEIRGPIGRILAGWVAWNKSGRAGTIRYEQSRTLVIWEYQMRIGVRVLVSLIGAWGTEAVQS